MDLKEKRLRVLHLMHDEKFVESFINKYSQEDFESVFILISKKNEYSGKYKERVKIIYPFSIQFFKLVEEADSFDFIIVYHLEYLKAYFINKIKKNKVTIIWSFFGSEIYNNRDYSFIKKLYSSKTQNFLKKDSFAVLKNLIRYFKYQLKNKKIPNKEVKSAISKIDYFAWYSEEEYAFLKEEVIGLPKFIKYKIDLDIPVCKKECKKAIRYKIVLGNSRAPENNHIDILLLLEEMHFEGIVLIPFSYGSDLYYAHCLKKRLQSMKIKIELLEEFLPYETYVSEISNCDIAIYNSFRQMALANILISIVNGSRVYLSEKNVSYIWLRNLGFQIFSIEKDLEYDLKNCNFHITEDKKNKNRKLYFDLKRENRDNFINLLNSKVCATKTNSLKN